MLIKKIFILYTILLTLFGHTLLAQDKHLILVEGNFWKPLMAPNLIEHQKEIEELPFSGFVMVGNSFTKRVMQEGINLTYQEVWSELKGLKNLYKKKTDNFLQINIDFPGDFWNNQAWERVTHNFAVVAQVAHDIGFKGIIFDDEPYTLSSHKMVNFKFPNSREIILTLKSHASWEKKGSESEWVDKKGYRNPQYNFREHMSQVTSRFKSIMQAMEKSYPNLTLLVYNGPSFAHPNSNRDTMIVTDVGLPREHEYKGAIFAGLLEGVENNATLHDMGESYRYRTEKHFNQAYQWRKYDIAKPLNNQLDSSYQWRVEPRLQEIWSKKVNVGFMVFNKGQTSNHKEYDTQNKSSYKDIEETLKKALKYSDKYVLYYAQDQDWLLPNQKHPLNKDWFNMVKRVNHSLK